MNKNIVIIHYNTPYLTECLVRSINLFVKDAVIYIFDNSDKKPFTANFDNVTILDNTKGQIINFDKWLEKYPKRNLSPGKINNWASAKHCYTVEKCIEMFDENFILLDSDVLLKKDISELFNDKYIYCAEVITQPRFNIKRVLPFICFINVKQCKEKDVHFFKEDEMYGLYKDKSGEKYDTGASFYKNSEKYDRKFIKCDNYIVHYKAGSWVETAKKFHQYKQLKPDEWLLKYKKYWSMEKKEKVIYTCITGGYDKLMEPKYITNDFDYICFTDNLKMESNVWQIRPLPKETENLSQVKKQRYVKINPHLVLPDYNISIWVDGNIEIKGDLNEFINENIKDRISVYVPQHPQRNCIYKEANAVIKLKKDSKDNVDKQINKYKQEGFPENYGLLQSNILLRIHNSKDCIKLMEDWFKELKDNSHRDQLSFNYVCWKNKNINVSYIDKMIYKSKYFHWKSSHTKARPVVSQSIKRITKNSITNSKIIKTQEINLY